MRRLLDHVEKAQGHIGAPGRWIGALVLLGGLFGASCAGTGVALGADTDTIAARRTAMLQYGVEHPWPSPECRINQPSACFWGKLSLALASLQFKSDSPQAAAKVDGTAGGVSQLISDVIDLQSKALDKDDENGAASKENEKADGIGVPSFHFLTAALLHRIVFQFGPAQFGGSGRVDMATTQRIVALFAEWASRNCLIADAQPDMVWQPWGSENHDLQRTYACWASADLLVLNRQGGSFTYKDGSTADAQLENWTRFFDAYLRARAVNGGFIEFFSPTYVKYDLSVIYNLHDSSRNAELKSLAGSFAALWWAMWGQEQVGSAHGGSKARRYDSVKRAQFLDGGIAWLYTGAGVAQDTIDHPAFLPLLVSDYRPPQLVLNLITQAASQAPYEVWTRELALSGGPTKPRRYNAAQSLDGVARYIYVAPGFIMGTVLAGRMPSERLMAISSQNRWSGVTMLGRSQNVVFARPTPKRGRSTYNAMTGVQKFGTQIVQALAPPDGRNVGDMVISFSRKMDLVEKGGWIFAADSAYIAARPAFGDYQLNRESGAARLSETYAPVIIQASPRSAFPTFEAFQSAVLAAKLNVTSEAVTFGGLDKAGDVRLQMGPGPSGPDDDGRLSPPAGWTLYSPFIQQKTGARDIRLTLGGESLTLAF